MQEKDAWNIVERKKRLIRKLVDRLVFHENDREDIFCAALCTLCIKLMLFDESMGVPPDAYIALHVRWLVLDEYKKIRRDRKRYVSLSGLDL